MTSEPDFRTLERSINASSPSIFKAALQPPAGIEPEAVNTRAAEPPVASFRQWIANGAGGAFGN
jgi:hypothetical protein